MTHTARAIFRDIVREYRLGREVDRIYLSAQTMALLPIRLALVFECPFGDIPIIIPDDTLEPGQHRYDTHSYLWKPRA